MQKGNFTTSRDFLWAKKHNIKNFWVLFSPCVVKKYSAITKDDNDRYITLNVDKEFTQNGVQGMLVGFD